MSLKAKNYLKFEFCQVIYLRICNTFYGDRKTFPNFCQNNRINNDFILAKNENSKIPTKNFQMKEKIKSLNKLF